MTKIDTTVYVDSDALTKWSTDLTSINNLALDDLEKFKTNVESLKDSWAGSSASSFLNSNEEFIKSALSYHENMKDINSFLITVIETMELE